jgi:hypothetical protein
VSRAKARVGCLLIGNTGRRRGCMPARCRWHVLELHHVRSNLIDRAANVWERLRMPERISVSAARSSLPVCIHPHALLWYTKHPIHIRPSARRTARQCLLHLSGKILLLHCDVYTVK